MRREEDFERLFIWRRHRVPYVCLLHLALFIDFMDKRPPLAGRVGVFGYLVGARDGASAGRDGEGSNAPRPVTAHALVSGLLCHLDRFCL